MRRRKPNPVPKWLRDLMWKEDTHRIEPRKRIIPPAPIRGDMERYGNFLGAKIP